MEESCIQHLLSYSLLLCVTSYSLLNYLPDYPYAFAASAFAFCHGLFGIVQTMQPRHVIVSNVLTKLAPLTLQNIKTYVDSKTRVILAINYLYLIPLCLELIEMHCAEDKRADTALLLRSLAILARIISLIYLIRTENNLMFGVIVLMLVIIKYGKKLMEKLPQYCTVLGSTTLFYCIVALYLIDLKRSKTIEN